MNKFIYYMFFAISMMFSINVFAAEETQSPVLNQELTKAISNVNDLAKFTKEVAPKVYELSLKNVYWSAAERVYEPLIFTTFFFGLELVIRKYWKKKETDSWDLNFVNDTRMILKGLAVGFALISLIFMICGLINLVKVMANPDYFVMWDLLSIVKR